ncbi:UNVERIFIED_CONTAM: hypothetical protein GTU68_032545 [Idotea baltica]|nr:hypothetical protein [Idotea baltica]
MMELGCESRLKETLLKNQGSCGPSNSGEMTIIGYDITGYDFYALVDVCFEPVNEIALYTYHLLRGASQSASDVNPSRPSFKSDTGYYTVSANTCYETSSQETLMGDILGDSSVIDYSSSLYFARGHLSPDADFMTEMEMDATYYYINAVPQWQVFNNGNWKYTEMAVRDLAESHGTDFEIWTGPWNILELDDVNSNPVEIFLGLTEDENVIPAPLYIYQVIYETSSDRGRSHNRGQQPLRRELPAPWCTDPSAIRFSWIDFDVTDLSKGSTYAARFRTFMTQFPLPRIWAARGCSRIRG